MNLISGLLVKIPVQRRLTPPERLLATEVFYPENTL
jgi:hypothetical protein